MNLFDTTTNKKTSGLIEVTKAIGSIIFQSSLTIDQLSTELVNIRVVRSNGGTPIDILKEDVPLSQFLLTATAKGAPIGSNSAKTYKTECEFNLALAGQIALAGNDVIRIELKGLKSTETYILRGISTFANAHPSTIFQYEKENRQKDTSLLEFNVTPYNVGTLQLTADIVSIDYKFDNGVVANYELDELKTLIAQHIGIAQIHSDGTVQQHFSNYLQLPLNGVSMITVKKDNPTAVTNFLFQKRLI